MPYFWHIFLILSPSCLCIRHYYMSFIVLLLGRVTYCNVTNGVVTVFFYLVLPGYFPTLLSSRLLLMNFLSSLSKALLGYLHLVRAFLRCCISLLRNSGLVQTVLALWVMVLITLYLATRLWWLSHHNCWSVCMGFL